MAYTDRELLELLVDAADDNSLAPRQQDLNAVSDIPFYRHFGSFQKAVIRAGLKPRERRPLTDEQFFEFFQAASSQADPFDQLTALLIQFTGLTPRLLARFDESWVLDRAGETIVDIPAEYLATNHRWTFRLPATFTHDGESINTGLPSLTTWALNNDYTPPTFEPIQRLVFRVAADAHLPNRTHTTNSRLGRVPEIRPGDLRATGGVRMARHGAPTRRIRRHLGLDHTNWNATVDEFFLWNQVHHDDFTHPDWEPVDPVLEPI